MLQLEPLPDVRTLLEQVERSTTPSTKVSSHTQSPPSIKSGLVEHFFVPAYSHGEHYTFQKAGWPLCWARSPLQ